MAIAASGRKWVAPGLILQAGAERNTSQNAVRYGLTASSKIGNAVIRNRARRRLRALAEKILPEATVGDYVLIARATTVRRSFDDLKNDLLTALAKLKATSR